MREAERERERGGATNRRDFEISASRSKETIVTSETEKRYLPFEEGRDGGGEHVWLVARGRSNSFREKFFLLGDAHMVATSSREKSARLTLWLIAVRMQVRVSYCSLYHSRKFISRYEMSNSLSLSLLLSLSFSLCLSFDVELIKSSLEL